MARDRKQSAAEEKLAARLLGERRAILKRLEALDGGAAARDRGALNGDNTPTSEIMEAIQESVMKEVQLASREVLISRLRALARAEERIHDGTYGRCEACGKPIPAARLRAMPEAVLCVPCAERGGSAP